MFGLVASTRRSCSGECGAAWTFAVPLAVRRHERVAIGPRVTDRRQTAVMSLPQSMHTLPARALAPLPTAGCHQAIGVIASHAIDDLRDLVEAQKRRRPPAW